MTGVHVRKYPGSIVATMNRENEEVRLNCFTEVSISFLSCSPSSLRFVPKLPQSFQNVNFHNSSKCSILPFTENSTNMTFADEIFNSHSDGSRGNDIVLIDNVSAAAASCSNALRRVAKRTELQMFGALRVNIRMPCRSDVV